MNLKCEKLKYETKHLIKSKIVEIVVQLVCFSACMLLCLIVFNLMIINETPYPRSGHTLHLLAF